MNRQVLDTAVVFIMGLLLGSFISRVLMLDSYGAITVILLVLVGVAAGTLGFRARSTHAGGQNETLGGYKEWWDSVKQRWSDMEVNNLQGGRTFLDVHWSDTRIRRASVAIGAFGLAIGAQILILNGRLIVGLTLYALAGIILIVWLRQQDISLFGLVSAVRIGPRAEVLLLMIILVLAFGARMVQVGTQPIGMDGDELKWTAQTYYDFIAQEKTGAFSGQLKWTPVSFYVNKVAFDIFGVDVNSPRVLTALLSVLATLVFYFVVRDMFTVSVALLATFLMATSYWDINTSRQAIVQSFTKLPTILALFWVIRGVDRQQWFYFLLCGVALYVGIMTYDTFFVLPPVILLYMIFRAALDRQKLYRWILYFVLAIAPMLLAYPIVQATVGGRQDTYLKSVSTSSADVLSESLMAPLLGNTLKSFAALFQALQGADYALNWSGPLLNPIVLPFFVVGFALVLARVWQQHNFLVVLSFAFCFFPAPILSGYTVPRVFYIGLPPIFVLAGVGMMAIAAVCMSVEPSRLRLARLTPFAISLTILAIAASDLYIYTHQLRAQADWLKRRSLIEAIQNSVESASFTFIPVLHAQDDYVWNHRDVIPFLVYTASPEKDVEDQYRILSYAELLSSLSSMSETYARVNILHDQHKGNSNDFASSAIETIQRCYRNVKTQQYAYFTIYTVETNALDTPVCYSLASLELVSPNPETPVPANQPLAFQWQTDPDRSTAFHLQIERRDTRLLWIEGESLPLENDWMFEAKADHYPNFSGDGYILDSERAGETRLNLDVLQAGKYHVWVRSLRNTREGHRSFITVGTWKFEFARENVPLATWNWEQVGQVDLKTGQTTIVLSREYGKEGWKPVLLDVILFSADPEFDPNQDVLWKQVHDTGQIESAETQFILQSGLPPGFYRWRVQLLDGTKLVDASGNKGIWSEKIEFMVK